MPPRVALAALVLGTSITAAGCDPSSALAVDANIDGAAEVSVTDASAGGAGVYVPVVFGDFTLVYQPSGNRYLNDHSIVQGPDGTWHLYGITDNTTGTPLQEHQFLHATSHSLFGPWDEQQDVLEAVPSLDEAVLWSPTVFEPTPNHWFMYYWAGSIADPAQMKGLRTATSTDLFDWSRVETTVTLSLRPPGGRDPMLLHDGSHWILYSVGVDATNHGEIVASVNDDPTDPSSWSELVPVITDPQASFGWGNLESPWVVNYDGFYYLFLTRTGNGSINYFHTMVFRSADPMHFAWAPITDIRAHAARVLLVEGQYYLTSAGWTSEVGDDGRGLMIAPLRWLPAPIDGTDGG